MSMILKILNSLLTPTEIDKVKDDVTKLPLMVRILLLLIIVIILGISFSKTFIKPTETKVTPKPAQKTVPSIKIDQSGNNDINTITIQ